MDTSLSDTAAPAGLVATIMAGHGTAKSPAAQREQHCDQHGPYVSLQRWPGGSFWSACPACEQQRAERLKAEEEAERAREAEQKAEFARSRRLELSGLEGRMLRSTFENFQATTDAHRKVLQACKALVSPLVTGDGGGLWLLGSPGTGKTHLGSAMVSHVINVERKRACIHSARELVRMLRSSWSKRGQLSEFAQWYPETEDEIVEYVGMAGLFVLDEIGSSFNSDAERTQLFDIIDLRYKHSLPTVLISNLDADGIRAALGERSFDRLREGARVLSCAWPSHRR